MTVRVLILWSTISGYMAACWRALAQTSGVELLVVATPTGKNTVFDARVMDGVHWMPRAVEFSERLKKTRALVTEMKPDVVVVGGWFDRAYLATAVSARARGAACVLGMDNPWCGTWRQLWGKIGLLPITRIFDAVVVPGERAAQYALRIGFSWDRIFTPL